MKTLIPLISFTVSLSSEDVHPKMVPFQSFGFRNYAVNQDTITFKLDGPRTHFVSTSNKPSDSIVKGTSVVNSYPYHQEDKNREFHKMIQGESKVGEVEVTGDEIVRDLNEISKIAEVTPLSEEELNLLYDKMVERYRVIS